MNSIQTDAIVLRAVPWSETSFIVSLLTADCGRIDAVAKGARRPKSPFEGAIDLLSVCRIVCIKKSGDVLDILTEAKLLRRFRSSERSLLRLHCGYYFAELLTSVLERDQSLKELYCLTDESLAKLDDGFSPFLATTNFEIQLLKILGHLPKLKSCVLCGSLENGQSYVLFSPSSGGLVCYHCVAGKGNILKLHREAIEFLSELLTQGVETISLRATNSATRRDVRRVLEQYIVYHFDRPIKLHSYLGELAR